MAQKTSHFIALAHAPPKQTPMQMEVAQEHRRVTGSHLGFRCSEEDIRLISFLLMKYLLTTQTQLKCQRIAVLRFTFDFTRRIHTHKSQFPSPAINSIRQPNYIPSSLGVL